MPQKAPRNDFEQESINLIEPNYSNTMYMYGHLNIDLLVPTSLSLVLNLNKPNPTH
jgi:hypothetical protein